MTSTSVTKPASSVTASAARLACRASSGTGSLLATSANRGSTSWRIRFRVKRGSAFIGSHTTSRPRSAQRAQVSERRRANRGRRWGSPMPAAPGTPEPRSRFISTVSAWSSAVWPVRTPGGNAARRASRARASRLGPSATWATTRRAWAPSRPATSTTVRPSAAEVDRNPWSTCQAVTSRPASMASTSRASESGPPETAQSTGVPAVGKEQRSSNWDIRSGVMARRGSPERRGPARGPVRGSRSSPAGWSDPPKPG